jgi:predicted nucleic acid-binding Zn ribbon protein
MSEEVPLAGSLEQVIASLRPGLSVSALGGVFGRWEELVGPTVAQHARPVSLADGILIIAVDQPGWATQLRFLERDLLVRIAEVVGPGAVNTIEIRVRRSGGAR